MDLECWEEVGRPLSLATLNRDSLSLVSMRFSRCYTPIFLERYGCVYLKRMHAQGWQNEIFKIMGAMVCGCRSRLYRGRGGMQP